MAERLVAMGFPIDWCECALKNSSGSEAAVQQLQRWQDEARRGSAPNVQDDAASNSLTPCSSSGFLPSVSYAESTGGSTNGIRLFPVTSSSDAVVPQVSHNWQNHQQAPLPKSQDRDSSKRKISGELERIKKLFRCEPTEGACVVNNAKLGIDQGSVVVESQGDCTTSKMDSLHDDCQTRNQPADGPYFAPADVFNHEHGRTRRNGGSLDLDGERVRMRDLAFQSAAMRMSEAAQIFRGGLQPDVGEIGPAFEFPACQGNDEEEDERGVDEGWTSIMDIDEPHTVSVPVGGGDSLYVASTGTSTEDDNQSVDGPEFAAHSQRGITGNEHHKCVTNQQAAGFDADHAGCDIGQSAKYRGRIPSSSWCPDPPRKLQRTHPHDPGIGAVNMDETGGGLSGSAGWRLQSQLSFGGARGEEDEIRRESKAQERPKVGN
eukprot:TRINITY_DN3330_c0_g1_i1.p1 TRINITY_DN3330_c0_g1~~TRINITY_DN3330_c0_g1_i1.p1  ORF type:complete len:433 (+),score=74.55 TRINITY_DN3330_c0_g1_i1:874-2172(+)